MIPIRSAFFALAALTTPVFAQGANLQILLGFAGDNAKDPKVSVPVAGANDVNRDGKVNEADAQELFGLVRKVFSINKGKGGFFSDAQSIIENGDIATYYADGGDGYIVRAIDSNGNGLYDGNEVTAFFKFGGTKQGTYGPSTLAIGKIGSQMVVFVGCNSRPKNRPEQGIYKLVDLNKDGDAKDKGESIKLFDSKSSITFPGKSGTVTLGTDNWKTVRTMPLPPMRFVAWNSAGAKATAVTDAWCYLGFQEAANKITKKWVFFNPSKKNGFPENADIASGALEDLDIVVPASGTNPSRIYNGFQFCEVNPLENGRQGAFYFTSGYGAKRSYGSKNAAKVSLEGVVLRGVDLNRDGDLQDKGEVKVFFNGSGNKLKSGGGTVPVISWFDRATQIKTNKITGFCTGLSVANGVVYMLFENGSQDAVLALNDKNKNGVIETGEVTMPYFTPSPPPRVYSSIHGPYTLNLHAVDPDLMVDPMPKGVEAFGSSCLSSRGLYPRPSVVGSPKLGNKGFGFVLKRAIPNSAAFLMLGFSRKSIGAIPLPLSLNALQMTGCQQLINPDLLTFTAIADASGYLKVGFPLPNTPGLRGIEFYAQFWAYDANANRAGLTTSTGLKVKLF